MRIAGSCGGTTTRGRYFYTGCGIFYLALLQTPGSATTIAGRLNLSRQRVNYHVRALESAGLVEEVERRARRGLEERVVRGAQASV